MARTVYIRDEDRETMGKNKPPSWPLVDYLGFLASLHNEMDQVERAQREHDYQQYLAAKRDAIIGEAESDLERADAILQAVGNQESAQEFMARLDKRIERKKNEEPIG